MPLFTYIEVLVLLLLLLLLLMVVVVVEEVVMMVAGAAGVTGLVLATGMGMTAGFGSGVLYEWISIADGLTPCGRDLDFSLVCEVSGRSKISLKVYES
jgi:hypothetical protein